MNDTTVVTSIAPVARIGVFGLPNLVDSMASGGLYVLIAQTPSARFPLLAASLAKAITDGVACTVIVPAEPELFIQRIESYGDLDVHQLLAANRLQLFVMQEEFSKKMFRVGAEGFVEELEHFEIAENSYLLFNQADDLLSLHDLAQALDQVDVLRKWAAKRRVTMLLIFSRATEVLADTLNALMDNLTGIARLGADRDGLEIRFDYWQSQEGAIAARNYRLVTMDSGLYKASAKLPVVAQAAGGVADVREEAEDAELHFFYMDPDLGSLAKQMPGTWHRVDTLVGMMHATRSTRSATSILSFQRDTNLRQLAEAVHTLRLSLGRRARIVLQEKGASLRYQNEALLLRLGLNLIVHRDVPSSRLPLLLDSLSGQIFDRDVGINFEVALASVLPTRLRGYLTPLSFVREAESILDQAQTLNIPCAMIIGKPGADMTITEALTASGLSRPGDLISTDGELCYLFLNACPESVMLTTLERTLGMPVDAAFNDIRFLIRREEIQAELPALVRAAEQGAVPDYAAMIPTPQAVPHDRTIDLPNESAADVQRPPSIQPTRKLIPFVEPSRTLVAASLVAVARAAEVVPLEASVFQYDNSIVRPAFGKKLAPRATRSALPSDPAAAPENEGAKRTN